MRIRENELIAAGVGALGFTVIGFLGVLENFGAHPFWAAQAGWVGGIGGAILFLAFSLIGITSRIVLPFAALLLAAALAAAIWGKAEFAASFAENELAGTFWFIGWHGVAAAGTLLLAGILVMALGRR